MFGAAGGGCNRPAAVPVSASPVAVAAVPAAPGVFRDVAREVGLDFRWGHGGKSPLTILETLGHGCAFLDYDGDGWLDILLVADRCCVLYHNDGKGRFTDVTESAGLTSAGTWLGVAVGDYDNDGFPDVYITGYGKCALYHNTGHGGFQDITVASGVAAKNPYDVVTAAAFLDLDGDGKLDLFAGRYIVFTPTSLQFCDYQGIKASCGVKNYDAALPHIYHNTGKGFVDVTEAWGFGAAHGKCLGVAVRASDAPENGVVFYASNDEQPCDLWARQKGGAGIRYRNIGVESGAAFSRDGLTQAGMGADWGDFNNDGRLDLVVATFQTETKSLYQSDGNDLYTEVSGSRGVAMNTLANIAWTARFFDYDNDAYLDLLFTNGHVQDNVPLIQPDRTYPQPLQLFHNEEGARFREMKAEGGPAFTRLIVGRGAAFGDYDNDGRVDVLVVDEEGYPLLLHNESRTNHHWLGVRLVGTQSNRDGVGARVTVKTDKGRLMREPRLCGGYISAHDPRLHFGLGLANRVESVTVRWPSGRVETLTNVPMDRYSEITEGKDLTGKGTP